ncbi:D-alanyl-D-alanine carboxypeptidase/D-alanyl-D-alanine endopeptidase [Kocuria sp. cx-455]|uniref:D-alanyl-D-alanine carboxypeptidase/D-alanyl-D-alanine endopeptidase n=1 Tax=Kocuria sp. cx-455 TaxID=2771377 RepID=UPI003D729123
MPQQSSRPPRRRRSLLGPVVAGLLIVALIFGSVWAIPAVLAETVAGEPGRPMTVVSVPTEQGKLPGVLDAAASPSENPGADDEVIQDIVSAELAGAPGSASVTVLDTQSGRVRAERAAGEARIPASNQKTLTALTVAEHLDPYSRLATTVETGDDPHRITLVAGGDTLLAPGKGDPDAVNGRAGLEDLAERTASALTERDVQGEVTVSLDTSLFSGPALNPGWATEDVAAGEITAVSPLAMYSHRVPTPDGKDPGPRGERPDNAGEAAAGEFRDRLQDQLGTRATVSAGEHARPEEAVELARVESAPLHEQAAYMLEQSDNSLAETLARVAARAAGELGSVTGVQRAIRATLEAHSIDMAGADIIDASGMAVSNRVTTGLLAQATRALLIDPDAGPYGQGLPLGGATGTLTDRFDDPDERAARGLTRAKTGTLNSVVSLSGYVQQAGGEVLVYSVIFNDVQGQTGPARDTVDRTVATLAQG